MHFANLAVVCLEEVIIKLLKVINILPVIIIVLPSVILFLCFFSPFNIAITSLGEERANLSTFRTFVRFALVWFCLLPLPLGIWEGLRLVTVALPGLFSYLFEMLSP